MAGPRRDGQLLLTTGRLSRRNRQLRFAGGRVVSERAWWFKRRLP